MATINAKVVQDYELKFQQSGLSDVNKLVANLVKSIVFVNDMAEKGVDLKVGVNQDTINNINDINKDMATLIEKTEDFNKAPTPEKYKEILDLTAKMEEKIRNVIKLSLEQGTIFKDNGKDIELLTKKLSDFQDELKESKKRAAALKDELEKATEQKTKSDDSMKKELKTAGFNEKDLEKLSTTEGAQDKLDSMKPGANNTYTKRQEKQRELLQKIIEENKIYEQTINDINTKISIQDAEIKKINQDINQTTKEITEQESAWSGIFNGLLEIEEQIKQNAKEAQELIANFKKIKEEFPKTIQSLASKAGVDPTSVDTMDKAKATLKQREGAGKKFGQSDAEYKEEIAYLRQIVDAHKEYQDSLEQTEEAMKKNERQLKKNKKEYEAQIKILEKTLQKAVDSGSIDPASAQVVRDLINTLKTLSQTTFDETKQSLDNLEESLENVGDEQKKVGAQMEQGKKGFIGAAIAATVYYAAIRALRKLVSEIISTVKELDKSLTEVAMVTNLNREEAWELVDSYQNLAKQVGSTTTEIAKLSVYFFRQGLAQKDALAMTEVAATAAKVASIDATESANFLTSAINGFGMASSDAMGVSDKFAALGASSASSYEELAIALSKVAPVAKVAGVDIDQMMGFIAKGVETTREAPENIGTAFKTIFARMTQLTDFGKTLEDGMSVNKVEEALALAGVALRDEQGNFRNMGDVITELGYKFDGLDRNTQSYIATAMAGTRQQSRLLAVLQNFDRTMELVDVSQNSAGATMRQHADYTRSMEAAMNGLTTSFQMLVTRISDSEAIIDLINTLSGAIDIVGGVMGFMVNATDSAILNTGIFISSLMALSAIFLLLKSRIMGFILSAKMKNAAMSLSTFLTNKDIAAKKLQILLENIQTTQIKKSTALILLQVSSEKLKLFFKKAVRAETLKNIVASVLLARSNNTLAAANLAVGGSAKFAGVGLKVMAKGFLSAALGLWSLLWPIGLLLLSVAAAALAIYGLVKLFDSMILTAEEAAENVTELKTRLNELEERRTTSNDMIERFKELRDQTYKTNEELEEMKTLMRDINAEGARSGFKGVVIDANFNVNEKGLKDAQDKMIADTQADLEKNTRGLLNHFLDSSIFYRTRKRKSKKIFEGLDEDKKMDYARVGAKDMMGVSDEEIKAMTKDQLEAYNAQMEAIAVTLRANLVDMADSRDIAIKDFMESLADSPIITRDQVDSIGDAIESSNISELSTIYANLTDDQKTFMTSLYGDMEGLLQVLKDGDVSQEVVRQLGGLQRVQRMITAIGQVETEDGLKLTADQMGMFLQALHEAEKKYPNSIADRLNYFSEAVKGLGKSIGISDNNLQFIQTSLIGETGLDMNQLEKDMNKVRSSGEEARRLFAAATRIQNNEALDEDMIDLQVNYSDLMDKITEGSLTYADVVAKVATITKRDLEDKVAQAEIALSTAIGAGNIAKAEDNLNAYKRLLLSYDAFVSDAKPGQGSQASMDLFKPQIDAIKAEIEFRKQLNQQHNDEIDAIQKKLDLQKSQLDLDRRIAALKKDTSIGAQAELAKAEDQKRKLTVDQNKFIRDSAMKEEIAMLEAQKQSLMVSQQERTNAILQEMLDKQREGLPSPFTLNPFGAATGT